MRRLAHIRADDHSENVDAKGRKKPQRVDAIDKKATEREDDTVDLHCVSVKKER